MSKISIINDEISDDIGEVVSFLIKHGIGYVELRSINKQNVTNISLPKIKKYADYLKKNKIEVSCIASPLLKWYPKDIKIDKHQHLKVENFYFKNNTNGSYETIFKIAKIFNSKYIRIFSFLKYKNFKIDHLEKEIKKIIDLAIKYNKIPLIENDPVCNIRTIDDLLEFIKKYNNEKIKILFDIGNLYEQGDRLNYDKLVKIKNYIEYVHIKDYSFSKKKYVVLGEGDINYKKNIPLINYLLNKEVFYSIETYTDSNNKYHDSSVSIMKLKEILKK